MKRLFLVGLILLVLVFSIISCTSTPAPSPAPSPAPAPAPSPTPTPVPTPKPTAEELKVHFIDVGQGDSILIDLVRFWEDMAFKSGG